MNRFLFSAALSALYTNVAAATTQPKKLTAYADCNIGTGLAKLRIEDDNAGDAGGAEVVEAKGETVNDASSAQQEQAASGETSGEQQQAQSDGNSEQVGETKPAEDLGASVDAALANANQQQAENGNTEQVGAASTVEASGDAGQQPQG